MLPPFIQRGGFMAADDGTELRHALFDLAEYRMIAVESEEFAERVRRGFPGPVRIEEHGDVWVVRAVRPCGGREGW